MRRVAVVLMLLGGVLLGRTLLTSKPTTEPSFAGGGGITALDVSLPDLSAQGMSGTPGVITITPEASTALAPGDTLGYSITWGAGARADGYAITVSAVPSAGWTNLPTGVNQTSTIYLLKAINAAQPDVNFTVTVCSRKGGTTYTNKCSVASWSVTRIPGAPGLPTIDSSQTIVGLRSWEMLPENVTITRSLTAAEWKTWDSASVAAGAPQGYRDSVHAVYTKNAQVQFCSVGYFTDNSRYPLGYPATPADSTYCMNQMQLKYPGVGNSPNARSLARTYCIQYNATGGTITNSTCEPPNSVPGSVSS